MPIQTEDIKLLKSQVMADTSDGGGAMTGNEVADGVSNEVFPDTSELDRTIGRVNIRELFGVAQTDDTDTLLGAHTIITDAPDDPLVHCTLMAAPSWGARRDEFREAIERYLVKGPRAGVYLLDNHYAASILVRLFSETATEMPAGGSAIVIRSADGLQEQYLRVLKVSLSYVKVGSKTYTVGLCELGQALAYDFEGASLPAEGEKPPAPTSTTGVYTTSVSGGARFYGIKPLSLAAEIGDYSVTLDGGIFAPLVPASTVESPIIDQYPLLLRQSLSRTALRIVTLPALSLAFAPGVVLTTPTAIEPSSVSILHGATVFTDDGAGNLKQGTTVVGSVDYRGRTITLSADSPSYGTASNAITYKPATLTGASTHSDLFDITVGNQGRAFVYACEPPPAPGSLTIGYMAQGRWYDLQDDANGKLAGADSSYGVGSINYTTGSVAMTLGAIPDVGSALFLQWGDKATASAIAGTLPAVVSAVFFLPYLANTDTLTLAWSRGSEDYTASCADGVLVGDATGTASVECVFNGAPVYRTKVVFAPDVLPDGPIDCTWNNRSADVYTATNDGAGQYTLSTPPAEGSISLFINTIAQAGFEFPSYIQVGDDGGGNLVCKTLGGVGQIVGTVHYPSGVVQLLTDLDMTVQEVVTETFTSSAGNALSYQKRAPRAAHTVALQYTSVTGIGHTSVSAGAGDTDSVSPEAWNLDLPVLTGLLLRVGDLVFICGGEVYYCQNGVVRKAWNSLTAGTTAPVGSATSTGSVSVTTAGLPANGVNSLDIVNACVDAANSLTVGQGVFRTASAPLKTGVFQIQAGAAVGNGDGAGVITGGAWTGTIDYARGVVKWSRSYPENAIPAAELSYNAVFLQYLPLDASLLGLETARLPLDGRVPIYRSGGVVVIHNTLPTTLPNPLTKGTAYDLGRERIASARVKTVTGATVDGALYMLALDTGFITFPVESDLTGLAQPFTVEHRIEDMVNTLESDISGKLTISPALTHDYPADTSFASGALLAGDVFARAYNVFDQATWTGVWSNALIGSDTLASYNTIDNPITTTNRGAVTERWALIFTSNTAFRIVGEKYGQVGTGDINTTTQPVNTATGVPFFTIPIEGWGGGWAAGNVLRLNTDACGTAIGVVRTILQGPDTLASDKFTLAFRGDVNA